MSGGDRRVRSRTGAASVVGPRATAVGELVWYQTAHPPVTGTAIYSYTWPIPPELAGSYVSHVRYAAAVPGATFFSLFLYPLPQPTGFGSEAAFGIQAGTSYARFPVVDGLGRKITLKSPGELTALIGGSDPSLPEFTFVVEFAQ